MYKKKDPDDDENSVTRAMAFFPNENDSNVIVYEAALNPSDPERLRNTFIHELGHVIGLRHEFAITGDDVTESKPERTPAKQFSLKNLDSIMSYRRGRFFQQSDKDGVRAFYKLKNNDLVDDAPVTDYIPQLRKKN